MNDLQFQQTPNRNLIAPVLIAFMILGVLITLSVRHTPAQMVNLSITHTAVYPAHTVFKSDSIVVGSDRAEDNLYVLVTLRVDDPMHLPLFIKDFTATLNTADDQQFRTSAAESKDLTNIYTSFPALKPLASPPLRREILIPPGNSAEGMVLLHFPVTQDVWDHRKSAILNVDFYHEGTFPIAIPLNTKTASTHLNQ